MLAFLLLAVTFFSPQPDSSPALAGIAHVAESLRSRSLAVKTNSDSVSVTDPDGTVILFTLERNDSHGRP